MTPTQMALAIQGGGPEGDRIAGAALAVVTFLASVGIRLAGVSGSSVGAIIAVLIAFGFTPQQVLVLLMKYLQKNRMLDPTPKALLALRLLDWERIPELCDKEIGPGVRMGQAKIPLCICVSNLDAGQPLYVSSWEHPQALIAEVLRPATSPIPKLSGVHTIPSLGTSMSPDVRRMLDSGWSDNTVDGVWDGRCPRVAVRLEAGTTRVRSMYQGGGLIDDEIAAFNCALNAASRPKTSRDDGVDIILPRGAGWDFSKTPEQVRASWAIGQRIASATMGAWYETAKVEADHER